MISGILINFSITLKDIVLNALNIIIGKSRFHFRHDAWRLLTKGQFNFQRAVFQTLEVDIIGAYVYIYIYIPL